MADGDPQAFDPTGGGVTLPDTPGDFSETVPNQVAAQPGKRPHPFAILTPAQEADERFRLNLESSRKSTLLGSQQASDIQRQATGLTPDQKASYATDVTTGLQGTGAELPSYIGDDTINFDAQQEDAKDKLARMQADQLAYENMPSFKGLRQGIYSLAGQAVGAGMSPEGWAFPEAKLGSVAWRAAHPLISDMIGFGVGQAAIQGGTNFIMQGNEIRAGLKKEFDPVEMSLSAVTGGAFGAVGIGAIKGGASLYRYGRNELEQWWRNATPKGPELTPEIKPNIAPEPPLAPADTFEKGAPLRVPEAPPAPVVAGTMPEAQPGTTRLYRAEGPGDQTAKHVWFSPTQFPGANEFIDVPENVAAQMAHGPDRIALPAEYAAVRQKIPEPPTPAPKPEAPSVFENLTDYNKLVRETAKEPQSFTQWVRSQGGLLPSEEVKAIYGRTKGDLVRTAAKGGKSLDNIREAGVQQGWLDKEASIEDVKSMLRSEDKGAKQYHPAEQAQAARIAETADLKKTMAEIDSTMRDIGSHPSQLKGVDRQVNKDIRNRAIEIAHTEDVHPELAVDRAMREYDEHAAAIAGKKFTGAAQSDIPFFPESAHAAAAPREGGPVGELGPGERAAGAVAPGDGGINAPSPTESRIAKRLKGMELQGISARPGETRPAQGLASANVEASMTPLENLQQMMRRISKELELTVRKGVHEKGALGQYDFETHIVRIKDMGPDGVMTWAHEVGHDVENRMGKPVVDLIISNPQSMKAFAGVAGDGLQGAELASEGFGEFMAGYITNREILERKDPGFVVKFREMMGRENPKLLATLDDAAASFERFQNAPTAVATASMIVQQGSIPKPPPNDPLKRGPIAMWFSERYRQMVNKQHPMTLAVRSLAEAYNKANGKLLDLRPDENPRALMQILGDAGFQKTVMDLTYGMQSFKDLKPEGPSYFSIVRRATIDPLTGAEPKTEAEYLARLNAWDAYKMSRWHLRLREQMKNGEIEMTRMPTPLTDGQAAFNVAEAERLHPHFVALAEEEYAVQKLHAKFQQEAGLRSSEDYAEIMHQRNREYVPLNRDMSGITESLGVGGDFRGNKSLETLGRFERTGSGRNVLSPTESTMRHIAETNDAANANRVTTALRDLILKVGEKDGKAAAAIGEMVPAKELRAMDINVNDAVYKAAIADGWTAEDAKNLVRDLQQQLGADIRTKLYRQEALKAGSRPIVFGWENGERFAIRLADGDSGRQLVELMDSMGPRGMSTWAQSAGLLGDVLTVTSSTLRAGATGTPTFMVRNVLRDAFMQFLLVPEAGVETLALANAVRGGSSYIAGDDFYRMYTSTGGIRGGVGASGFTRSAQQIEFERQIKRFVDPALGIEKSKFSPSALQAERVKIAESLGQSGVEPHKQIWFGNIKEAVERLEISETAGRVGLFKTVYESNIKMGRDHAYAMWDAAEKARDFIDYGRRGSKMEGWARSIPFLNANVQGVDKFVRTYAGTPSSPGLFFKPYTQQQAEYQQALRDALLPRVAALATLSAGITYLWEDDPVYQRIPVQQRSTNWIFRVPFLKSGTYDLLGGGVGNLPEGMQGAWIFIPKPWEPGTIFNLAEKAVEFINSGDLNHLGKAVDSMRYTFNVPGLLDFPLVRTAQGLAANYDNYFQRPIIPDSMKGIAPHLQANEYTNGFYKALAQGMNWIVPSQDAHHFLSQFGPVGAMLASPWSPMEAQYMMQGMFGDWPRELGGIGGIGRSLINGLSGKEFNFQISDVPALRAFVKDKMAMGEPMNELYNQIGQNGGRLSVANKSFSQLIKDGRQADALQYLNTLDSAQSDYVRTHQVAAGPLANVLHPLDRTSALASVTRNIKNGLLAEGGLASLTNPNVRIKLEDGKRDQLIQTLNEYTVSEARNGLIVQGQSGFKYLPLVDTKPYLATINAMSPEVGRELSARLAQSKVMPIESIQKYWPQAQTALRAGSGANPTQLTGQIKAIAGQAASQGYEGGGRKSGRGAVDAGGLTVKRGKAAPVELPAAQ